MEKTQSDGKKTCSPIWKQHYTFLQIFTTPPNSDNCTPLNKENTIKPNRETENGNYL